MMTERNIAAGARASLDVFARRIFTPMALLIALMVGAPSAHALDDGAISGDVSALKAAMQQKIAAENQAAGVTYASGLESAKKNCDLVKQAGQTQATKDFDIFKPDDPSKALKTGTCLDSIMNMKVGFGLSLPGVQQIIDMIIDYIIKKACAVVMQEWNGVMSQIQGNLNTNINAPFGLGGASASVGGSQGVNVLGMGSDPSQILSTTQSNPNLNGALDSLTGLGKVGGGTQPASAGVGSAAPLVNNVKSAVGKAVEPVQSGVSSVKESITNFLGVGNN